MCVILPQCGIRKRLEISELARLLLAPQPPTHPLTGVCSQRAKAVGPVWDPVWHPSDLNLIPTFSKDQSLKGGSVASPWEVCVSERSGGRDNVLHSVPLVTDFKRLAMHSPGCLPQPPGPWTPHLPHCEKQPLRLQQCWPTEVSPARLVTVRSNPSITLSQVLIWSPLWRSPDVLVIYESHLCRNMEK